MRSRCGQSAAAVHSRVRGQMHQRRPTSNRNPQVLMPPDTTVIKLSYTPAQKHVPAFGQSPVRARAPCGAWPPACPRRVTAAGCTCRASERAGLARLGRPCWPAPAMASLRYLPVAAATRPTQGASVQLEQQHSSTCKSRANRKTGLHTASSRPWGARWHSTAGQVASTGGRQLRAPRCTWLLVPA